MSRKNRGRVSLAASLLVTGFVALLGAYCAGRVYAGFGPAQGASGGGSGGSSTPGLNAVLTAGNTTGGKNIVVSVGDGIGLDGASPAANTITFGTGGGHIFQIVGPSDQNLQIQGGAGQKALIADGSGTYIFDADTAAAKIQANAVTAASVTGTAFQFYTNGVVLPSGNLGTGTLSPDVAGLGANSTVHTISNAGGSTAGYPEVELVYPFNPVSQAATLGGWRYMSGSTPATTAGIFAIADDAFHSDAALLYVGTTAHSGSFRANLAVGTANVNPANAGPYIATSSVGGFVWSDSTTDARASSAGGGTHLDVGFFRDGAVGRAGLLDPNSSTTATALRVYATTDVPAGGGPTANADWLEFTTVAGGAKTIGTNKVGTGTAGNLLLAAAGTTIETLTSGGGVQVGSPTGGDKGAGTLNATGLYIAGVAVVAGTGAGTTIAGTANQITASASTGAVTLSLPNAITLPGTLTLGGTLTSGSNTLAFSGASITGSPTATLGATTVTTLGTGGNVTLATGNNLVLATSGAGTQIGTGATQLLAFYGATPTAQIAGATDVLAGLVTLGFRAASSNPPLNLGTGAITCGSVTGNTTLAIAAGAGTNAITVTGGAGSGAGTGGAATYSAGAGGATGTGGLTTINDGAGGGTSGAGGGITIQCTTPTSGNAGAVQILGGAGVASNNVGSTITITAGNSVGTGAAGAVNVTAGNGVNASGGVVQILGGNAGGTNHQGGTIFLQAGLSTGNNASTDIQFQVNISGASGTSANTQQTVLTLGAAGLSYTGAQNATTVGNVSLTASKGGSTSGAGGAASLISGGAGTAGGACGAVNITGGSNAVASGSTAGGQVNITAGSCTGTTSTGAGGALVFAGGQGGTTSGPGGAASLTGGAGTGSTSGAGGLATIAGGAGSTGSNNNNSGGIKITTGAPSGTGTGNVQIQTGFTNASGASVQTMGDRLYIAGHSVTMSTTTATATTVAVLNLPTSNSGGGCQVIYQLVATDGTNYNTATGSFNVSCSNKGGTVTATTAAVTDEASNTNSGTLSGGTTSATVASQAVSIKMAPTFTVISPTSVICNVTVIPFGNGVTVTAQ